MTKNGSDPRVRTNHPLLTALLSVAFVSLEHVKRRLNACWVMVPLFALLAPSPVAGVTCPSNLTVTARPGDGSTCVADVLVVATLNGSDAGPFKSGSCGQALPFTLGAADYSVKASGSTYLRTPGTPVHCVQSGSCAVCAPQNLTISIWARFGSINGDVTYEPSGAPAANKGVLATVPPSHFGAGTVYTDANGHYAFLNSAYPPSNNWGMAVSGAGDGPGTATYNVTADGRWEDGLDATIESSSAQKRNLTIWLPGYERPSARSGPCIPHPVSVATGNVFLDQADATIPGLGPALNFVRSYNSATTAAGRYGIFGPGWNHAYERRLALLSTGLIMIRKANGEVLYFEDPDGDSVYKPSSPSTEHSSVTRETDGSFVRSFRAGGSEHYDAQGRLATIVDPAGNVTTLTRDGTGQLTGIADSGGRALTLGYSAGRVASLSGPAGPIATYGYDAGGHLTSALYADGSGYDYTYDAGKRLLTVADKTGRVVETHTYDANGQAASSEVSGGIERRSLSYAAGRTTVTDALNNVTTYDWISIQGSRYVTRTTGPCASCGGGNQTQSWTYDDQGRMLSHTDGAGNRTTYTYDPETSDQLTETDALGNTTSFTYDSQGRTLTRTDPLGGQTTWTYGPSGPTSIMQKVDATTNRTTQIAYTPQGKPETITDPRGKVTTLHYDAIGDLDWIKNPVQDDSHKTAFEHDSMGRRTRTIDALGNPSPATSYDLHGRVSRVTNPNGTYTEVTYDGGGRRLASCDALGCVTQYTYDPYGRLSTVTDCAGAVIITYGYDAMSNLRSITDARGKITRFDYDSFNRVSKVTYPGPEGYFETFTYDAAGRRATRTDRKGVQTTFAYDAKGLLLSRTYSDGTGAASSTYDAVGRLLTAANDVDTLTWTYDLAGQALSEASAFHGTTRAYDYDLSGNLTGRPSQLLTYDDAGQLVGIRYTYQPTPPGLPTDYSFSFAYDLAGRRTELDHPNGVVTAYTYDPLARLTNVSAKKGTTIVTDTSYTYDDVDNRTSKTQPSGPENYTYDPVNRLEQVVPNGNTAESYEYDLVGNRIASLAAAPWSYDDRNELLSYGSNTFTYDANGNLATKNDGTDAWSYVWDAETRLKRVLKNGALVAEFSYDPLGRRLRKVAGGTTTTFVYDGEDIALGGGVTFVHGPGIDEPLAQSIPAGTSPLSYFHADGLGSILRVTDTTGTPITSNNRAYDAFGNLVVAANVAGYAFTGREWDPETRLYYYRARYYDPQAGRFLSEDPIRYAGGLNWYSYVAADPVNNSDPLGLRLRKCARPSEGILFCTNHVYVCNPDTSPPQNCGLGFDKTFLPPTPYTPPIVMIPHPNTSETVCETGGDTKCVDIETTPDQENKYFECCKNPAPDLPFGPNQSCHEYADDCLRRAMRTKDNPNYEPPPSPLPKYDWRRCLCSLGI